MSFASVIRDSKAVPVSRHTTRLKGRDDTYCGTMLVRDEPSAEHALDGIVHPGARLEGAERPETNVLSRVRDAHQECERRGGTHHRAELRVQGDRTLVREHKLRGRIASIEIGRRLVTTGAVSDVMLLAVYQWFGLRRRGCGRGGVRGIRVEMR